MNLYLDSWDLYLHHTAEFDDDLNYYLEFCNGHKSLEMFAGYGRVTNFLASKGVDIEIIELSPDFASKVKLPANKIHVGDVVTIVLPLKFDRIIAAYNSFCLLIDQEAVLGFFKNLAAMLTPNGLASLSYYHPDAWPSEKSYDFKYKDTNVKYVPEYNLNDRAQKKGVWVDRYLFNGKEDVHTYPVRIYESSADLEPFLKPAGLKIKEIVENYHNPSTGVQTWVEYILQKA